MSYLFWFVFCWFVFSFLVFLTFGLFVLESLGWGGARKSPPHKKKQSCFFLQFKICIAYVWLLAWFFVLYKLRLQLSLFLFLFDGLLLFKSCRQHNKQKSKYWVASVVVFAPLSPIHLCSVFAFYNIPSQMPESYSLSFLAIIVVFWFHPYVCFKTPSRKHPLL